MLKDAKLDGSVEGRPFLERVTARKPTQEELNELAQRIRRARKRRPWGERKHSNKLPGIPHNKRRS